MTHASGIRSSSKLINDLKLAKENDIRCVQIRIENESLVMQGQDQSVGTFESDYDKCIEKYLKSDQCCYILYRTDNATQMGYDWLFLHWVPDNASIREKMLYASTRATIKREFGESYFIEDLTGYDKNDLMYCGYLKHIESKSAPPPLTLAEQELIEIKKNERETALGDGHRTLKSNGFPPTDDLIQDLNKFVNGKIDFLEMVIEIDKEIIRSESSKVELQCDQLRNAVNPDKPRYYLYRFRHEFENESYEPIDVSMLIRNYKRALNWERARIRFPNGHISGYGVIEVLSGIVFIYNMPGFSSSVKERMLYSSCKAPFIELLQSEFELTIQRKLEVISGDFSDLVTDNLLLDIHPPQIDSRPKITKPPGPNNRGPRRLMKN